MPDPADATGVRTHTLVPQPPDSKPSPTGTVKEPPRIEKPITAAPAPPAEEPKLPDPALKAANPKRPETAPKVEKPEPAPAAPAEAAAPKVEFEIVLGKRQAASLTFLVLVVVAVCSGGSYLIGKATAPAPVAAAQDETQPQQMLLPAAVEEAPLFDNPVKGPVYLQLGAVDRGVATLLAHGARRLGYGAFVSPGANESVFRVLVGPFKSAEEFEAAQQAFQQIGLDNFARRYQEE